MTDYLTLGLQLLPVILPAISALQKTDLPGPDKLKILVGSVTAGLNALPEGTRKTIHAEQVSQVATDITNLIVGLFNLRGIFETSKPLPGPPLAPVKDNSPAIAQLEKHIAKMKERKAAFESGNAPDKEQRIANLTKNIATDEAELASLR